MHWDIQSQNFLPSHSLSNYHFSINPLQEIFLYRLPLSSQQSKFASCEVKTSLLHVNTEPGPALSYSYSFWLYIFIRYASHLSTRSSGSNSPHVLSLLTEEYYMLKNVQPQVCKNSSAIGRWSTGLWRVRGRWGGRFLSVRDFWLGKIWVWYGH